MLIRAQGGVTLGLEQGELEADFGYLGMISHVASSSSRQLRRTTIIESSRTREVERPTSSDCWLNFPKSHVLADSGIGYGVQ